MARLFSISIPFDGEEHTALVNIRQQGCDLVCVVRYIDKQLQYILPGGSLEFGLLEGLKLPKRLLTQDAENLVNNTVSAISRYLQGRDATALPIHY
jgi:hypothetical protein